MLCVALNECFFVEKNNCLKQHYICAKAVYVNALHVFLIDHVDVVLLKNRDFHNVFL